MVTAGRRHINLKAPIIKMQGGYVWMNRHWPQDFCDWMREEKMTFTEIKMRDKKLTLYFKTPEECTMFGLKYDREKQEEIFRTTDWS